MPVDRLVERLEVLVRLLELDNRRAVVNEEVEEIHQRLVDFEVLVALGDPQPQKHQDVAHVELAVALEAQRGVKQLHEEVEQRYRRENVIEDVQKKALDRRFEGRLLEVENAEQQLEGLDLVDRNGAVEEVLRQLGVEKFVEVVVLLQEEEKLLKEFFQRVENFFLQRRLNLLAEYFRVEAVKAFLDGFVVDFL